MSIQLRTISGEQLATYIDEIARLRIQVFREYPYLYDGTEDYEKRYLQTYMSADSAMAVLAMDRNQVIGVSTGVAMAEESAAFKQPFVDRKMDTDSLFYCGESVLLPQYRGRGIYKSFFTERETFARELGGMSRICFCGVVREDTHPLKPQDYQPLDEVWRHFGYQPQTDLIAYFPWKDVDQQTQTQHPMMFWLKDL